MGTSVVLCSPLVETRGATGRVSGVAKVPTGTRPELARRGFKGCRKAPESNRRFHVTGESFIDHCSNKRSVLRLTREVCGLLSSIGTDKGIYILITRGNVTEIIGSCFGSVAGRRCTSFNIGGYRVLHCSFWMFLGVHVGSEDAARYSARVLILL